MLTEGLGITPIRLRSFPFAISISQSTELSQCRDRVANTTMAAQTTIVMHAMMTIAMPTTGRLLLAVQRASDVHLTRWLSGSM